MSSDNQTRRAFLRHSAATAAAGAAVVGGTGLASADGTAGFGGIFGADFDVERDPWAFLSAAMIRTPSIGSSTDVETLAERARNEFVANEDDWIAYGNWLIDEHGGASVGDVEIAVTFTITRRDAPLNPGSTTTGLFVDVDQDTDTVEKIEWDTGTPMDPDYYVELKNRAAENAADELQRFRREWIADDEDGTHELPSDEYLNELAGSYFANVLLGDDGQSIIEVLLGEVDV